MFFVLHPLNNGMNSTAFDLKVQCYAGFSNLELAGPTPLKKLFGTTAEMISEEKYNLKTGEWEDNSKPEKTAIPQVVQKDKPVEPMDREQKSSSLQGILTIATKAARFVSYITGFGSIFTTGVRLANMLLGGQSRQYAMPTTLVATTNVRRQLLGTMCLTEGLDNSVMLSVRADQKVSNDPSLGLHRIDYDEFKNYKMLPSLLDTWNVDQTTSVGTSLMSIPVNPMRVFYLGGSKYSVSHLSNLASLFTFWRGDLQYVILFSCSKMVSARFRIVWLPDPTTSDSLTTAQLADTISQIVDVNGDTMTKFSIPYLNPKTWLMVANYEDVNGTSWVPESTWKYANGQIRVILETPVAASQTVASSKIYFSIFVAGGPYFEVNRPQTIKTNYVFPVDTQAESLSLWDECAKQPEPILPCDHSMSFNVTSGDSVGSFSDYFHRYTLFSYAQANPGILYYDLDYLPSPGNLEATAWKRVFTTFHAHRGSIRYKIVPVAMKADYGGRSVPMGVVNNYLARDLSTYGPRSYDSINGVHFFDLSENSAEFQVPYNNDEPLS